MEERWYTYGSMKSITKLSEPEGILICHGFMSEWWTRC